MSKRMVLVHEWVTGGGMAGATLNPTWAAEGRAIRRAIAADFASLDGTRVLSTLDDRLPDEPGPWTVVRVGPGEEEEQLVRLAKKCHHVVLIAPETGGILAARARLLGRVSTSSLGSSAEAIEATSDKFRLGAHLTGQGIPTPRCLRVVPAEGLPEEYAYPAVLKPVDGCGSVETYHISGPGRCPESARDLAQGLLQPWIPGLAMSASFLVDRNGRAALIGVGRQQMELRGDRYVYRGGTIPVTRPPADGDPRRAVESVEGLLGFVGVDFIWNEATGSVTILEINPRATTSCVALTNLLPPGKLAECWINAVCSEHSDASFDLAGIVHARRPLSFDADGTIHEEGGIRQNS